MEKIMKRDKMSKEEFRKLFPLEYKPHKVKVGATQNGYVPILKEKWQPAKSKLTPAQWHKQMRNHPFITKPKRKTFYECPVCKIPLAKTGWCGTDRKWATLTVKEGV